MKTTVLNIIPVAKPRMTRADKWTKRPATTKYWKFKDELNLLWKKNDLPPIGNKIKYIAFFMPFPKSWSAKKKEKMEGEPHTVRPDLDNLLKAFLDSLCKEDGHVATIGHLGKYWSHNGYILISL